MLAYYDDLDQFHTGAFWTVANKIEPWEPVSQSVPVVWRYNDLREHVLRSVDLVTPEIELVARGYGSEYIRTQGRLDLERPIWRDWIADHPEHSVVNEGKDDVV